MQATELILLSHSYISDKYGNQIKKSTKIPIPIIKVTSVSEKEFYDAGQQHKKPSIRFVISSLNYNEEEELEYMGTNYSILRSQTIVADETNLICERRVGND